MLGEVSPLIAERERGEDGKAAVRGIPELSVDDIETHQCALSSQLTVPSHDAKGVRLGYVGGDGGEDDDEELRFVGIVDNDVCAERVGGLDREWDYGYGEREMRPARQRSGRRRKGALTRLEVADGRTGACS